MKFSAFAFLEEAKEYYNPIIEQAKEIVNKYPYISILEDEYGKDYVGNYTGGYKNKGKIQSASAGRIWKEPNAKGINA